jgi:TolB-like protein
MGGSVENETRKERLRPPGESMSSPPLLRRLRERKLVQWALAYAAGAFVVFQLLDALDVPLGLTPALQRAILVMVGIGFPITLVLAWYHGEKGRQRVSGPELLMVTALLVVAGAVLAMLPGVELSIPGPSSSSNDERPVIAVLPLDDFSPDPSNAYFAGGMREELGAMLAKVSGLTVRGGQSVMRYRDDPEILPEIARELGVGFVIDGSVRIAGGQVTLTAELRDAVRDEHLWGEEYDREFSVDDIVFIQREIARHVVAEVQAALTPEDEARLAGEPTGNTEAYEEYLKGRFHWSTRSAQGLETAIGHFQRALALDSTFALAYSGLADCYTLLNYFSGDVNPTEMFRRGEEAAQEAIRLAPDLAAAHASLGYLRLLSRRDWIGAEESLRHAIFLDPTYVPAHQWLADLLADSGRFEEAYREGQRAIELDPLSFSPNYSQASRLTLSRNFEAAISQYERTIQLYPQYFLGWAGLANALLGTGDIEGAVRNMARSDELFGIDPVLSETHLQMAADFHRTGTPGRLLPAFDTVSGFLPDWRASSAMWVGDTAKALDWLEEAAAENWPDLLGLRSYFLWDPLRDHPRFQALVEDYFGVGETSLSREP